MTPLGISTAVTYLILGLTWWGVLLYMQVLKGGVFRKALACVSYALLWPLFLIVRLRTLTILKKTLKPFHVARYVLLHDIEMKPEQSKEANAG